MKRRDVIGAGAALLGVGTVGWVTAESFSGGNNDRTLATNTAEDVPEAVAESRPLAGAFFQRVRNYFPSARVFIRTNGEIVVEYQSKADSKSEFETEFNQIAIEYARVAKENDHEPPTLTIVVAKVQVIVPGPAAKAHVRGDINREAYLKTLEVMPIERRTDTQ